MGVALFFLIFGSLLAISQVVIVIWDYLNGNLQDDRDDGRGSHHTSKDDLD